MTYFVGRILATGGGCLFAMVLNRLLWPWYRNRWEAGQQGLGGEAVPNTNTHCWQPSEASEREREACTCMVQ